MAEGPRPPKRRPHARRQEYNATQNGPNTMHAHSTHKAQMDAQSAKATAKFEARACSGVRKRPLCDVALPPFAPNPLGAGALELVRAPLCRIKIAKERFDEFVLWRGNA